MLDYLGIDGVDGSRSRHRGLNVLLQVECGWGGERDLCAVKDIWDNCEISVCLYKMLILMITGNM